MATVLAALLLTASGAMLALAIASWGTGVTGVRPEGSFILPLDRPPTLPAWITAIGLGVLTAGKLWVRADTAVPSPQRPARILGLFALALALGWAFYLRQPQGVVSPPLLLSSERLLPIAAVIGGAGVLVLPAAPPPRDEPTACTEPPCQPAQPGARIRPGRRTAVIAGTVLATAALTGGAALRARGWLSTLRPGGVEESGHPARGEDSAESAWGSTMPWAEDGSKIDALFAGVRGPLALWWFFGQDTFPSGWCLAALDAEDGKVLWRREGVRARASWVPWLVDPLGDSPILAAGSPDGRLVAVGTEAHRGKGEPGGTRLSVIVLQAATGEELCRVSGEGRTALIALTNTHLALQTAPAPNSRDQVIEVWDIAEGRMLWSRQEPKWLIGAGARHLYLASGEDFRAATDDNPIPTGAVDIVEASSGLRTGEAADVSLENLAGGRETTVTYAG